MIPDWETPKRFISSKWKAVPKAERLVTDTAKAKASFRRRVS